MNILKSLSLIVVLVPAHSLKSQTKTKMNVVLVYADDLGRGMLSCYGQNNFKTPNIDHLFNNGFSFNNAYGCMVSAASRASLLTGYHDCRITLNDKWSVPPGNIYGKKDIFDEKSKKINFEKLHQKEKLIDDYRKRLTKNDLYLPQVFKEAGYITGEIGKLGWGWTNTPQETKEQDWDYYYGYLDHVRCHGYYPPFLFENGKAVRIKGNNRANCGKSLEPETDKAYAQRWDMKGKKKYSCDLFEEKIKEFIKTNKDTTFFLYYASQLPHGPVMIDKVNKQVASNPNLTEIEKEYASMVLRLDEEVGMISKELKRYHLEDNTIIIFASDNGHEIYYSKKGRISKPYKDKKGKAFDNDKYLYRSNLAGDVFNGNNGFAGLKRSNLEGGVRVPLIISGPYIPINKRNDDVVALYDLLPTVADWLGVKLQTKKSGVSLLPLITNFEHLSKNRAIYFSSYEGAAMVRNDGWKVRRIHNHSQLYNIRQDPNEKTNLWSKYPIKTEQFEEELLKVCRGNWDNGVCNY